MNFDLDSKCLVYLHHPKRQFASFGVKRIINSFFQPVSTKWRRAQFVYHIISKRFRFSLFISIHIVFGIYTHASCTNSPIKIASNWYTRKRSL